MLPLRQALDLQLSLCMLAANESVPSYERVNGGQTPATAERFPYPGAPGQVGNCREERGDHVGRIG